jgi:hypothetical protein
MQEVDNILRILREMVIAMNENDAGKIKNLSNETIHSATISQDPDNIIVAVFVYSIGKVFERESYRGLEGWDKFYETLKKNIDLAIKHLEKNELDNFRTAVGKIRNSLNSIDGYLGSYVKDVFRKAEINKAFKMYEHGLSAEKTAELLGVSLWDMASYIGQSTISEAHASETLPINKRIKIAEDIFS